jgi:NADH-quinone oxidoreductase subunit G
VSLDPEVRQKRTRGLYDVDTCMQLHKSQDNPYVNDVITQTLGGVGSHTAHELLHTHYQNRKRILNEDFALIRGGQPEKIPVRVCVGTSCFLRGSQHLLQALLRRLEVEGLADRVDVGATFCHERCDRGPTVNVNGTFLEKTTLDQVMATLADMLQPAPAQTVS